MENMAKVPMGVDWGIPYFGWCRKTPKYLVTGSVYCWVYLIPLYKSNMWLVLWVNFLPLLVCKDSLVRILRYVKRHWHGEYAFKKCPWNVYIYINYWDMCILPDLAIYESEDRWQAAGLEWSFRQILVALKWRVHTAHMASTCFNRFSEKHLFYPCI
jgi:hypothetical protein